MVTAYCRIPPSLCRFIDRIKTAPNVFFIQINFNKLFLLCLPFDVFIQQVLIQNGYCQSSEHWIICPPNLLESVQIP